MSFLAPTPDFRYVSLEPGPRPGVRAWASVAATGGTLGVGVLYELGLKGALLAALATAAGAILVRRVGGPSVKASARGAVSMAIVPWGILVQPDVAPRVLRWAAVKNVQVDMVHGRDGATPSTLWSVVTIETDHERLAGRTAGAVSIDRLIAHVGAYADEQAQAVALDLEGRRGAEGPFEPVFEPLLSAARAAIVGGGPDSSRLCLPASGYRRAAELASLETEAALRRVISDRVPRSPDPRALAAILAAELGAKPLAGALVSLVQSPHPIVAAVAKVAAHKLGVAEARVGAVSEVAAFLHEVDVAALSAWAQAS